MFALSLGVFAGAGLLGWAVTTTFWTNFSKALGANVREFVKGFSIVFLISYLCWIAGSRPEN